MEFNEAIVFEEYQRLAIEWSNFKVSPYLAIYCGGGKTYTSLYAVRSFSKVLIVCPAFLVSHWIANIRYCYPKDHENFFVVSYGKLKESYTNKILSRYDMSKRNAIIFDEAQYLKNPSSLRTKAVYGVNGLIEKGFKKFFFLSGTCVTNTPLDLYPYLKKFAPEFSNFSREEFILRYCAGKTMRLTVKNRVVQVITPTGASNVEEFKRLAKPYIYYVGPDVVEKNLPPIIHDLIVCNSGVGKILIAQQKEFYRLSQTTGLRAKAPGFTDYSEIRKIIAVQKVKDLIGDLNLYLSTRANTVIFCWHEEVGLILKEHLKTEFFINGKTSLGKRDQLIKDFNQSTGSILIAQIKACGVGIELPSADTVLFIELSWDPAENEQAFKRVHRRGQNEKVRVTYFVLDNSVDISVLEALSKKITFINNFLASS